LRQDNNPPRSVGKPLEHVVALLTARGGGDGSCPTLPTPHSSRVPTITLNASMRPHTTRRSLDTGRSSSSNPLDEAHVPSTTPGTPQANGPDPLAPGQARAPGIPGQANAPLAPGGSAPPGQRCDLAGPAAVAIAGADPLRHRCFFRFPRHIAVHGARPPAPAMAMDPGAR
jgi:hypothetical protein